MTVDHILAARSKNGEIYLFDETDEFTASFKEGKWVADCLFDYVDLDEDFKQIEDDGEILRLMSEARAALNAHK